MLGTREFRVVYLRRRRECPSGHRFTSYEVLAEAVDWDEMREPAQVAPRYKLAADRRAAVLANPDADVDALAQQLHCSKDNVRRIRKHHGISEKV